MQIKIKNFGKTVDRLINGQSLSRMETREAFIQILQQEQSEIHQGAFLAAITAKGPTPREIAGAWDALYELDTVKAHLKTPHPVLDNCGTGMDAFKTFNISTAAALIGAAGEMALARHGARAITSRCGTVDICEALGVDVECEVDLVQKSIEQNGVGIFNGMSQSVHPRALFRILSRMSFGSILNIAASLANPASPRYGVRGVHTREMVLPVAQTMREIGFHRALVFHGLSGNGMGGMDELSPVDISFVAELTPDGNIREFELTPEKLGLSKNADLLDIAGGDHPDHEALRLIRLLSGKDKSTLYETICLNAAPLFYISGEVSSVKEGLEKSRDIVDSGRALDRLRKWVAVENRSPTSGTETLESLLENIEN